MPNNRTRSRATYTERLAVGGDIEEDLSKRRINYLTHMIDVMKRLSYGRVRHDCYRRLKKQKEKRKEKIFSNAAF
jgi:hypothetical protein